MNVKPENAYLREAILQCTNEECGTKAFLEKCGINEFDLNTDEGIKKVYDTIHESYESDILYDAENELRCCFDQRTDLECPYSRHYESEFVAYKCKYDDSWLGWTYWSGGGKHGEPEAMDIKPVWLNMVGERTIIERIFEKV